jgi:uncharacterized protein (TIGR03437 family)
MLPDTENRMFMRAYPNVLALALQSQCRVASERVRKFIVLPALVLFTCLARAQGPVSVAISSVTPSGDLHPGDRVTLTVNLTKTPASDNQTTNVKVTLEEQINNGQPRNALTGSGTFNATGKLSITLDTYSVPPLVCQPSFQSCNQNPRNLSDLIQNTKLTITATTTTNGVSTNVTPETLNVVPFTASLDMNTQPMNTRRPAQLTINGSTISNGGGAVPGIVLIKTVQSGCVNLFGAGFSNLGFKCTFAASAPPVTAPTSAVSLTMDTTVSATSLDSEDSNVDFIGSYDVLVSWTEQASSPSSPTPARQAVILNGYSVTAQPQDDNIRVTKITGFTYATPSGPQTPFTWTPGQPLALNLPPGGELTLSKVEGTYRLSKYSQALIFPVLKANGHLYGVGYSYVRVTYGQDTPLMDYQGEGSPGPTYAFIELPKDPITSFELVLLMSPPDEKITDFTGSNVVDFLTARSFAQSNSIAGTGNITADLMITAIYPIQAIQTPQEFVTLIAGKQTIARVFIKSVGPNAQPVPGVTAQLRCQIASDLQNYGASPSTPPITAQAIASPPDPSTPPNLADASVDFIIPSQCSKPSNAASITAQIVLPPGVTDPNMSNNTLTRSIGFATAPVNPFRIGYVLIPYQPGQAAATFANAGRVGRASASLRLMYPVADGSVRYFPLLVDYGPWTMPMATIPQWEALLHNFTANIVLTDLGGLPAGEQFDQVIGFLPWIAGAPIGGLAGTRDYGLFGTTALASDANDAELQVGIFAHEIGHNMGLRHVFKADPANGCPIPIGDAKDSAWPFPDPTIQSQGYFQPTFQVLPPSLDDLMSYCRPANRLWISPYSAQVIYENGMTPPKGPERQIVFGDLPMATQLSPELAKSKQALPTAQAPREVAQTSVAPQDLWLVTGSASRDGASGQLDPFLKITSTKSPTASDPNGNYCLRFAGAGSQFCFSLSFIDSEGNTLDQQPFTLLMAAVTNATAVTLSTGGQDLASLSTQPNLTVSIMSPKTGDQWQASSQTIQWTSSAAAPARYAVQYSYDNGTSWLGLASNLTATQFTVDASRLQGGDQVLFRVLAGSGLSTASAQAGPITIVQAPHIGIATTLDLHTVVATQSADRTFSISNTGTGPLRITAITSSNPQFQVLDPVTPAIIMAGESADLDLRFLPQASGPVTGSLQIQSNDSSQPVVTVAVQGTGVDTAAPEIGLNQTSLSLGSTIVGQSSTATLVVTNYGVVSLNVQSISVTAPFALAQNPAPFTLALNGTVSLILGFAPSSVGAATGTLTISSSDPAHPSLVVILTATGVAAPAGVQLPQLRATNPVVNGASFAVGLSRGALGTVFGSNLADSTMQQTTLPWATTLAGAQVVIAGIAAPLYYVSPTQINFEVPFEAPLGPVTMIVSRDGYVSAPSQVTIRDYAPGVFQYARTSTAVDPIIVHGATNQLVSPANPVVAHEYLVAYLTGFGNLTNAPPTGNGAPGSQLATSVDPATATLGAVPATVLFAGLTPGYVGLVQINFQVGALPPGSCAPLVFGVGNVSSPPVNLATGAAGCAPATAPALTLSANAVAFGTVTIGSTADRTMTLQNTGTAVLNVSSLAISGTGFSVVSPSAPFSIAPSGSQSVTLRFAPAAAGAQNGTLTIASNDPLSTSSQVALSGTGAAAPSISVSPTTLSFGSVTVGKPLSMMLTINNTGTATLNVSSISANNPLFTPSATSASVAPTASFNVSVLFAPTGAGAQSATLTLASNDPAHPSVTVPLSGTGVSSTAPTTVTLSADGGTFNNAIGLPGVANAVFVNRLTPPSYPATLTAIQIYFGNRSLGLQVSTPFTLVAGTNPSGSPSFSSATLGAQSDYPATVSALGAFNTYTLPSPITITSGDFVVGFAVVNPPGLYPADEDQISRSQGRSYISSDGATFSVIDSYGAGLAGNFGIRAVVTVN